VDQHRGRLIMPLDSDTPNADAQLHVEFYENKDANRPFIRIMVPGDTTNIIDQPVRDDHKERFPRQWLHFQMQQEGGEIPGTKLSEWQAMAPGDISSAQVEELQVLKFRTVEQVATASDAQVNRVGMGGVGLRLRAQAFLRLKTQSTASSELAEAKAQLAALQAQVAALMEAKGEAPRRGRPPMNDRSA
jgi:hypothetical protein